jgi:hypothetical protein
MNSDDEPKEQRARHIKIIHKKSVMGNIYNINDVSSTLSALSSSFF